MSMLTYAVTTSSFTQPSAGSTVAVSVTSTVKMWVGQILFIDNGGYYSVSSVTEGTTLSLKNLGLSPNVPPSTSVPSGSMVGGGVAIDSSGNTIVVGDGTAGTPEGGVVSVQGVSGGTTLPISGTVTVSNLSSASPSLYNNLTNTGLSGTFAVTNGSASITASTSQNGILSSGDAITFASQTSTYQVNSVSGTSITLASSYTGTTNSATTATYVTTALSGVVKSTPGTLFGIKSFSVSTGGYLMFFNSSSVPNAGDIPLVLLYLSGTPTDLVSVGSDFLTDSGLSFSNGISFGISSVPEAYFPVVYGPRGSYLMVTYE